jgi:hypothetical protein
MLLIKQYISATLHALENEDGYTVAQRLCRNKESGMSETKYE